MRYRLPHTVLSVDRKSRVIRAWKDDEGSTQTEEEDLGWFVTLTPGHLCAPVGPNKPDFKVGQRVDVVLEPRDD